MELLGLFGDACCEIYGIANLVERLQHVPTRRREGYTCEMITLAPTEQMIEYTKLIELRVP